ncbi:MAG: adenylyltransferase/cytidyltransferase family protein [Lachnospiraceae bacterium]|nr:adenylyltransferase/cytidyltransferase family protein [Lachnospiraceae bacterium]
MPDNRLQELESIKSNFPLGVFAWYDFKPDSNLLYLFSRQSDDTACEFLRSKAIVEVCSIEELKDKQAALAFYDYIVGIDIIEESKSPVELLNSCRALLNENGRLLLGTENRYAIKYICGDRDPYTNHSFDGIENYRRLSDVDRDIIAGRCYSMAELRAMLADAGFVKNKFYSAMPSLQETQLVYAEEYEPVEELAIRYFPLYHYPDSVFLEEQFLYTDLIKNGMFHKMANAYIIECSMDGSFDNTLHATISLDRGRENALVTSICEHDGIKKVFKKAIYEEGTKKLIEMQNNLQDLRDRGIRVVDSQIDGNSFIMPFVDSPIAIKQLKAIAKKDRTEFFKALDSMYELILQSSEHTDIISEKDRNSANGRDLGPILEKGYIDMVPLNCFYDASISDGNSRFIYYDQEFYIENCPAKAIMHRSVSIIYDGSDKEFERMVPRKETMDRYGLSECEDIWMRMSSRFTETLRNQKELRSYYESKRIDGRILYTNREKINYSAKEYQRIFVDIFDGFDGTANGKEKKLILFGSGRFTERFLFQFANDYEIYSIIDNNSAKWGTTMEGIPINSPDVLMDIPAAERHIIICIKGYNGVVNQLKNMGITDYHIYDPGNDYPNKRRARVAERLGAKQELQDTDVWESEIEKPYNVGYIAGVFDLFHIGHLNMFKRAKEQCRYLIVGVVSDEGVRLNKQAEPFVPFEERIEMVRSCKYVDEAVKLPLDFCGTRDMFKIYHFDVQFSGSDYEHDPAWLAEKQFLEKNGATMVFFPYTQSTSSTKLKMAINTKRL